MLSLKANFIGKESFNIPDRLVLTGGGSGNRVL